MVVPVQPQQAQGTIAVLVACVFCSVERLVTGLSTLSPLWGVVSFPFQEEEGATAGD